jgi:hypothetical protein
MLFKTEVFRIEVGCLSVYIVDRLTVDSSTGRQNSSVSEDLCLSRYAALRKSCLNSGFFTTPPQAELLLASY